MPRADQRRSPRFLYSEVVRVVACTGSEVLDDGDPIDTSDLVGKELVVESAVPTVERDAWLIGARGFKETEGWTVWFAEDSLESTGLAEDWRKGDKWEWLPIDQCPAVSRWRDTVWVDLVTDWGLEGEDATPAEHRRADALAKAAAKALAKLVPTKKKIKSTTAEEEYAPMTISLWLKPADALAAYERIVSEPTRSTRRGTCWSPIDGTTESGESTVTVSSPPSPERDRRGRPANGGAPTEATLTPRAIAIAPDGTLSRPDTPNLRALGVAPAEGRGCLSREGLTRPRQGETLALPPGREAAVAAGRVCAGPPRGVIATVQVAVDRSVGRCSGNRGCGGGPRLGAVPLLVVPGDTVQGRWHLHDSR